MVDELPLVVSSAVRSPFDLALITPEAKRVERGEDTNTTFALGGGQAASWGITLDGISAGTGRFASVEWASVNTPSLDAITEFTVDTNGYKAEYGRASGGIMTFSSKSGTKDLHGTVYEFLRNDTFDARRFFEARRGALKQHDFGWSVGGPVVIPKLYHGRQKTFFFSAMEWFRNRVGASSNFSSVPTPEMYQGDFRNWVDQAGNRLTIYDPTTTRPNPNGTGFIRTPFENNIIPQTRFSTFAQSVLKLAGNIGFPNVPATPGTSAYVRNNYVNNQGTALDPWTKFSTKIDHNFSDFQGWGESAGDGSENTVYSAGDDLTWINGKHTFKMGYLWERIHYNGFGRQTISGLVRGDRLSTSIPGNNNLSVGGGNGFASFPP